MKDQNDIKNYRRLRRAIGILGVALPIGLVVLSLIPFFKTELQPSISHFYYSNLRELFTGSLCATGLFLILYQGFGNKKWWKNDILLTNISGAMAFCVALVPTNPENAADKIYTLIPYSLALIGWTHYAFAAILFIAFSILSIKVFTIGQEKNADIPVSVFNENNIYHICGYSILVFIVLVPVFSNFGNFHYSTLILEALSLFAFGIAWLIKGRALGDKGVVGEKLYREHNV